MRESALMRKIRDLSKGAVRLWRNNVGVGLMITHPHPYTRQAIITECIELARKRGGDGSRIRFGLAEGSGDLIGFRELTIGPEHVGLTVAQFVSCEVKTDRGAIRPDQLTWEAFINSRGGHAFIARSVEDAERRLTEPLPAANVDKPTGNQ